MKDATKVWDKKCEDGLEKMVSLFRKSIINDAEEFTKFRKSDTVNAQDLEIALYKSIMTLNETNKTVILKRMDPDIATNLIQTLEERAIMDVSLSIIEDLEENYDKLSPEIQKIVRMIKNYIKNEDNEDNEDEDEDNDE